MTPCDGTAGSLKWCCGVDTSCCNDSSKYKLIAFEFRGAIPNTATAASAPWPTATSPTPHAQADDGGLSGGAKAGIGIGAAIGGLALIGLGFLLARRSLGNRRTQGHMTEQGADWRDPVPPVPPEKTAYRHELSPAGFRSELEYSPHNPHLAATKQESAELPS